MEKFLSSTIILLALISILCSPADGNTIEFRIPEEQPAGYFVGDVLTASGLVRNELRFSLMSQGNKYESYFHIDPVTGNLSTKLVIDREHLCEFTDTCEFLLEIAAETARNASFFAVVRVLVIIEDVNDNRPEFASPSVQLPMSEDVLTGASFTVDGARDRDTSSKFALASYELVPVIPNDDVPFNITFTQNLDGSSIVKLVVVKQLDREVRSSYKFNIIAKDGGNPPLQETLLVEVTVTDKNDNAPIFSATSYNVTVQEDVNLNHVIMTMQATDLDEGRNGEVVFRLSPHQTSANLQYFSIDEATGELRVIQHLNLNSGSSYRLIVEATDQGDVPLTSQTFVLVTVIDTGNNPPEIYVNLLSQSNHASVSEYATIGAVVAHVAVIEHDTGRNGDVICNLYTRSDVFALQRYDVKEYKVIVNRTLDRERERKHNVSISCEDKGAPKLTASVSFLVYIDDENDNQPRFDQERYFANIDENNEIGDIITTVRARDADIGNNSVIRYKVTDEGRKYVFVGPVSGVVKANRRFDRENKEDLNVAVTIIAEDQGSPAMTGSTSVIIVINDLNDQRPLFDMNLFRFWIDENLPADTLVGKLSANDTDANSNTRFTMKMANNALPFIVLRTGEIKTNRELDREFTSDYTFEVMAIDNDDTSLSSTATVTVFVDDKNDNAPIIDRPSVGNNTLLLPYMTDPDTVVYRVLARDIDNPETNNAKLTYALTTLNKTNYFTINPSNGAISLVAPISHVDFINKLFVLKVTVRDNGVDKQVTSSTLRVLITARNGTAGALPEDSNSNFVIAVVVATVTIVISAGIIVTICIIRRMDSKRREKANRQKVLTDNMYSKNDDEVDNIFPIGMDSSYQDRKKKEVSFSLEENGTADTSHSPGSSEGQGHESLDHILLEPPPQYQLAIPRGKLDDSHSDMSGDSNGDSGKGGSDDDLHIPPMTALNYADIGRPRERWESKRNKTSGSQQMTSFPTRYQHPNNVPNNQKIIPFSFKKPNTLVGNGLTDNVTPTTSSYGVPMYYEEDSQDSSGFQSIDSNSNSNMHLNNQRKVNLTGYRGSNNVPPDCVV